jgi:hypothetical protein
MRCPAREKSQEIYRQGAMAIAHLGAAARTPQHHQGNCTDQRRFPVAFARKPWGGNTPPLYMAAIFGEWHTNI